MDLGMAKESSSPPETRTYFILAAGREYRQGTLLAVTPGGGKEKKEADGACDKIPKKSMITWAV
jgi:hypothetical protein